MIVTRECVSPKGDVSGVRKVCQLIDRCDGHMGMKGDVGRCDNFQEV